MNGPAESAAGSGDWNVCLLGRTTLRGLDGQQRSLERKAAAVLAYLTIEGHTPRSRLTLLLWPDTREAAARNNLVHLLRKVQQQAGVPLIEGRELLSLTPEARVDVHGLFPPALGAAGLRTVSDATLLGSHDFDDCPELEDWLRAERERLEEWCLLTLRERARALEAAGEYDAALVCVLRLLDLDPLSEDAHHRLMRLHALIGNRHRALRVFERLCVLLHSELNAEPLHETVDLARAIRQAQVQATPTPRAAARPIPLEAPVTAITLNGATSWAAVGR